MRRSLLAALAVLVRPRAARRTGDEEPIVEPGSPNRRAETAVILLLLGAAACAVAFIVLYAADVSNQTQYLGLALAGALVFLAAAFLVAAEGLVVSEDSEEEYVEEHPAEQEEVTRIVTESGSRITRKRLLVGAAGTAAGALGLAAITPALSLGPIFDVGSLYETRWRRGLRLIGEDGLPLFASHIEQGVFYTAFPEHANRDKIDSPVVVVRLDPAALHLPPERRTWAPDGIVAYSKICTHAGCAIALYRKPTFPPVQPRPALVCPCHYSTFDPATGGTVLFGPAGRDLPQLPLYVDRRGRLRSAGNFSGPVGPSWWGVRLKGARHT